MPRGSAGQQYHNVQSNNVLFNDLNSVATGTDRAPPAIAAAEHLAAAAWTRPLLSYSFWCPDVQPGAKGSLVDKVLLATVNNEQIVVKASKGAMGPEYYMQAAVLDADTGVRGPARDLPPCAGAGGAMRGGQHHADVGGRGAAQQHQDALGGRLHCVHA